MKITIDLLWLRPKKVGGTEFYIRNLLDGFLALDKEFEFILLVSKDNAETFKKYAKDLPVILGSGINKHNISEYYDYIDGAIVGTSFKYDNDVNKGIDPEKVREFVDVIKNIE